MASKAVAGPVSLRLPEPMAAKLDAQLFPGDGEEHGAVIGAAVVRSGRGSRLLGRRLFLATDGVDYVPGKRGHRMLTADFVRRCALACASEGLAYLAVHNHDGTDQVAFSQTDLASHRRGYPALVDILDGPPVGGLVFARRAVAGDVWASADHQIELDHTIVVGSSQQVSYPSLRTSLTAGPEYDRQVRLFGDQGQEILGAQKVAIIGAGGAGSLINEYLARLGVGHLVVVDFDRLDPTNYPRVVGARLRDLRPWFHSKLLARLLRWQPSYKVTVAERVARESNPAIRYEAIVGDITEPNVAERLVDCDAIFLAADSMQARLVVNAICHQYLVPVWQVGAKVVNDETGAIQDVFSVIRRLIPGQSCLWCNELINTARLAEEAVSQEQRAVQRYVDEVPAPSVITLNAVACAHAVDQYLFATLGLQESSEEIQWLKYRPFDTSRTIELPRREPECSECEGRLGTGNLQTLPLRAA